jgi:Putative bacterial sensory transduction regulator
MPRVFTEEELDRLGAGIEAWLERQLAENPVVAAVERDEESGERRWFVRVRGEQKDVFSIWFHLGQRTLHYETYVMPAPEENHAAFFEHLLRRNRGLYGAAFAIGHEDAIFLIGRLANESVDEGELDRILGSLYLWVEQFFRPALRIGFASRVR